MAPLPPDPTLDEIRAALAPAIAANAAFDGWGKTALKLAAEAGGIDPGVATLAFPGGTLDMIDAWFAHVDAEMVRALPTETLAAMKIRERIRAQVAARLAVLAPHRDALRRALGVLAMPQNSARGARLGWRSVDLMWRQAGDTAADFNHYSKRLILGGVYAATIAYMLDDESAGLADTHGFLSRRIEGIMRFEKLKGGFRERTEHLPSLTRLIGRLRYPSA